MCSPQSKTTICEYFAHSHPKYNYNILALSWHSQYLHKFVHNKSWALTSSRRHLRGKPTTIQTMETRRLVRAAHIMGQWTAFFWPLDEGALLKWRHICIRTIGLYSFAKSNNKNVHYMLIYTINLLNDGFKSSLWSMMAIQVLSLSQTQKSFFCGQGKEGACGSSLFVFHLLSTNTSRCYTTL